MTVYKLFKERFNPRNVTHIAGESILETRNLSAAYNGKPALVELTFKLNQGERVAVLGPNGAGKSTLFKVIAGVMPAAAGEVRVFGHEPGHHICIAYVPQRSQVDQDFPATVRDVVMMGRAGKIGYLRWPGRQDRLHVDSALEQVGLAELADRPIGELSIGQQRRAFIAQALAQEADLILMDEPLAGLDTRAEDRLLAIIEMLTKKQITLMVATHDFQQAGALFDRVLLLNRSLIAFDAPEIALSEENIRRAYGEHLHFLHTVEGQMMVIEETCHDC